MGSVPYLLQRLLLSGRRVSMPSVGTLCLERVAAGFVDVGYLGAPCYCLVLDEGQGDDFIVLLARYLRENSNVGGYFDEESFFESASGVYDEWFEESFDREREVLVVEGLCELECGVGVVALAEDFASILQPFGAPVYIAEAEVISQESGEGLGEGLGDGIDEELSEGLAGGLERDDLDVLRARVLELEESLELSRRVVVDLQQGRRTSYPRVQGVSKFWWVFSVIVFVAAVLWLGYTLMGYYGIELF